VKWFRGTRTIEAVKTVSQLSAYFILSTYKIYDQRHEGLMSPKILGRVFHTELQGQGSHRSLTVIFLGHKTWSDVLSTMLAIDEYL
jgi:hypothetical protein